MKKPFLELNADRIRISTFNVEPDSDYIIPVNAEGGEFPNCCPFHKDVFRIATEWFEQFPNCCKPHSKMAKEYWFKKENYNGLSFKIVQQLSYTEHHILTHINDSDWYKDITDFIDYNVWAFGQPANGLHIYLNNAQHFLNITEKDIPKTKKKQLIDYIKAYFDEPKEQTTDLNILNETYQKWFKEFPFDLTIFSQLKSNFEKRLPFIDGELEYNKYLKATKGKLHTKQSLIEFLVRLTNNILTQVNTYSLYERGLLTEPQKIKLELLLNERKLKLDQGYINQSPNENQRYRNILKEWYKDELAFIKEIIPVLEKKNDLENTQDHVPERTATIIRSLNKYRFENFLRTNHYDPEIIYKMLAEHSQRETVPYAIALLKELNYLDYFFREFATSKIKGYKKLAEIFTSNERRIKGNILVLNPKSTEDTAEYTSHTYSEMIRKELEGR